MNLDYNEATNTEDHWYALRTNPKYEHICGRFIFMHLGLEVFCPRISYYKNTIRGRARFVEALFPCYIFVKCDLNHHLGNLISTQGVKNLVSYGTFYPALRDETIEKIRCSLEQDILILDEKNEFQVGETVEILDGPFLNLAAIVKSYDRTGERVRLMLEFLGQTVEVTLPPTSICAVTA